MSSIAIIEADALMRSLLVKSLAAEGYRPRTGHAPARGAVSADLIIIDLFMPRHMGAQRLRAARSAHPGAPIIAISGQFSPGLRGAGPAAEALRVDRVIAKPFDCATLLEAVRSVIGPAPSAR